MASLFSFVAFSEIFSKVVLSMLTVYLLAAFVWSRTTSNQIFFNSWTVKRVVSPSYNPIFKWLILIIYHIFILKIIKKITFIIQLHNNMNLDSLPSNSDRRVISAVWSALYIYIFFCVINRHRLTIIKRSEFDRLQCSHLSLTALNPGPFLRSVA
jgi:hypothetical protein